MAQVPAKRALVCWCFVAGFAGLVSPFSFGWLVRPLVWLSIYLSIFPSLSLGQNIDHAYMYIQYKHKHRVIHIFIQTFLLLTCTLMFLLRCFLICWHADIQVACFYSDLCTHRLVAVVAMWFGPFLGAASTSIVAKTIYVKDSVLCIARSGPRQTGICLTCKVLNVTKDCFFYTSWFCSCSDLKIHKSLRLKIATRLTTLRHFTREFGKQT